MSYQRHAPRRPRTVLAAVVMAYTGAAVLVFLGLMFSLGTGDHTFLGSPAKDLDLGGATIPLNAAVGVGAGMTAVGVLLLALAVFVQRGSRGARAGLTVLGAAFVAVQIYVIATGDALTPLSSIVWIMIALLLLWTTNATAWFRRVPGH